jgi:hypothetical protein
MGGQITLNTVQGELRLLDFFVFLFNHYFGKGVWFHLPPFGQLLQHLVDDSRYLNRLHLTTSLRLFWNHS